MGGAFMLHSSAPTPRSKPKMGSVPDLMMHFLGHSLACAIGPFMLPCGCVLGLFCITTLQLCHESQVCDKCQSVENTDGATGEHGTSVAFNYPLTLGSKLFFLDAKSYFLALILFFSIKKKISR